MTNFISILITGILLLSLVLGLFLGFTRGLKKSILRIIIVIACIVFTFLYVGKITDYLFNFELNGQTIEQIIQDMMPEEFKKYIDLVIPVFKTLFIAIGFVVLFLLLQLGSMMIYGILGIFIKKKKNGVKVKQYRLAGALVGLLQGAAIAFILCAPLTGLSKEAEKVCDIELDNQKLIDLSQAKVLNYDVDFKEYNESKLASVFDKLGGKLFVKLTTTTNAQGKEVTLSGQIDALIGAVKIANQISTISNIDLSEGLNANNINEIKNIMANLDTMKAELSEEALDTLNELVTAVASDFTDGIDLSNVDLATISFAKEGEILEDLYSYQEDNSSASTDELVKSLADSDLIIPIASASNVKVELSDSEKNKVNESINNLEGVDEQKIADLKDIFGITE